MKYAKFLVVTASLLALFAQATRSLAANCVIVSKFPADSGPGYKSNPDEAGAVGPKHIVDFDGLNFVVHDKSGKVLLKKSMIEFWASAEPAGSLKVEPNDPRCLYDPLSGRWFAVVNSREAKKNYGYLAVSTSSDPAKPWKGVQLPMSPQDLGLKIGVDKNGFYAAYCNLTRKIETMHDCIAIPKEDAIAPGGPDLSHATIFHNLQIESFPATDLDPKKAATAPEILLNREFGNECSKLYMYKITWSGKTASIAPVQNIPLSRTYYSPNGASQKNEAIQPSPGGHLRADEGRRTICCFARGGSIFICNEAKRTIDSRPGILWCEVSASDGKLLQEGFVDDKDHDYLQPSLAVDAAGNIGLGCSRTSDTEFPSAYVMIHAAGDPPGTMRAPVLAVPGTTYLHCSTPSRFGSIPWGNYSTTCIDPSNSRLFWTCQQYQTSTADKEWQTTWISFRLSNGK